MTNHPMYEAQLAIEADFRKRGQDRREKQIVDKKKDGAAADLSLGQRLIDREFDNALANVKAFVDSVVAPKRGVKPVYSGIVKDLQDIYQDREESMLNLLTFSTFSALLNGIFRKECRLSNLGQHIGMTIQEEARLEAYFKTTNKAQQASVEKGISKRRDHYFKAYYADRRMDHAGFQWNAWDKQALQALGIKLIEMVIAGTGYFEEYNGAGMAGDNSTEIRASQWLLDTWAKNESSMIAKAYRQCPMVMPPRPWEDFYTGGYYGDLAGTCYLLRLHDINDGASMNTFSKEHLARLSQLQLTEVRNAVNAIQATPWVINRRVLEVAQKLKEKGGDLGGVPQLEPLPELPDLEGDFTEDELKKHKQDKTDRRKKEARRKSQAARALATIEVAKEFSMYQAIYFPHNLDFRGRVYSIPTGISPQGDDLGKGLLLLSDPPTCESLDDISWLAIHGANLAGVDKVSFAERIAWVEANEEHILKSAADPLGYTWWAEQDDQPMQFLAFCFEWESWCKYWALHKTAKGFTTGMVVAFDGSCSGLQHFSAILRDPIGGQAVNLVPGTKPNDIYRQVADLVNKQLKKDAKEGTTDDTVTSQNGKEYLKLGTKTLAQEWLNYGVTRSTCKRSVMTTPYGSREFGFAEQVYSDIIELAENEGTFKWINGFQASKYLAKLLWAAVRQVVVKAVVGMEWLQKMARLVTKEGRVVTWMTPLGLPVQQSYMEIEPTTYSLRFGGKLKRVYNIKVTGNINRSAQASGIAPNFIHSMDASHLMLTVNLAQEAGINHFAMIHDSYGTSVAQAGLMFRTVREAFIKMYTENDVLANFRDDMLVYISKDDEVPTLPTKGDLDINVIIDSLYAFA